MLSCRCWCCPPCMHVPPQLPPASQYHAVLSLHRKVLQTPAEGRLPRREGWSGKKMGRVVGFAVAGSGREEQDGAEGRQCPLGAKREGEAQGTGTYGCRGGRGPGVGRSKAHQEALHLDVLRSKRAGQALSSISAQKKIGIHVRGLRTGTARSREGEAFTRYGSMDWRAAKNTSCSSKRDRPPLYERSGEVQQTVAKTRCGRGQAVTDRTGTGESFFGRGHTDGPPPRSGGKPTGRGPLAGGLLGGLLDIHQLDD